MKSLIAVLVSIGVFGLAGARLAQSSIAQQSSQAGAVGTEVVPKSKLETLLSAQLEGVDGTEVIVSRVTIPPNTALPKHWHPGEEFAYVLEGSVVLWRDGEAETTGRKGDVLKVSLKQVHTAVTRDQGATILVFRVHEQGKPERVLVE